MTTFYIIYFAGVVVALLLYILSLRLSITSNNSKLFRRMWIYPLTSDAIVVEIK